MTNHGKIYHAQSNANNNYNIKNTTNINRNNRNGTNRGIVLTQQRANTGNSSSRTCPDILEDECAENLERRSGSGEEGRRGEESDIGEGSGGFQKDG